MNKKIVMTAFLSALLCACASIISQTTMNAVDKSVSFSAIQKDPDAMKGKVVLLGGQIIATTPKTDETWIEFLEKPLDRQLRPTRTDQSGGRFFVRFKGFLDPSIYAVGRTMTVAGDVEGKAVRPLNEMNYTYPVLSAREHYLWAPDEDRSPRFQIGIGGFGGGRGGGLGGSVGVGF